MLTKLLESVDDKIFTAELKQQMTEAFEEAAEARAKELTESAVAELEAKNEEVIEERLAERFEDLNEKTAEYLDRVVGELVEEKRSARVDEEEVARSKLVLEAFETMVIAGGVDLHKILTAAKDDSVNENEELTESLMELKEKYNDVVNENMELQAQNDKLLKTGIILEMKEGLSILQAQRFEKLAEMVTFDRSEDYIDKLEDIKESVIDSVETKSDEKLDESENKVSKPYSHLI